MRAIVMENIGKPRVLKIARIRIPAPGPGQVLVKIHATSVNPRDLHLRSGRLILRKPMPHILGADLAGQIEAVADDVRGWEVGARVAACFAGLGREINGSYAEYCAVPAERLIELPDELDYQRAVAAGASFADAHLALVTQGKLKKADLLVVRGAAGIVGAFVSVAVSVPIAKSTTPPATVDADPLEDPPGIRFAARGLTGVPKCAFSPFTL